MADYLSRTSPVAFVSQLAILYRRCQDLRSKRRYVKCDVIVVDGGHSHDVPIGDLNNCRDLANLEWNVLDDTNGKAIIIAWSEVRAAGLAVERFACTDHYHTWTRLHCWILCVVLHVIVDTICLIVTYQHTCHIFGRAICILYVRIYINLMTRIQICRAYHNNPWIQYIELINISYYLIETLFNNEKESWISTEDFANTQT